MKIEITQTQMNLMLAAVEHGFRECERGKNLEFALSGLLDLYVLEPADIHRMGEATPVAKTQEIFDIGDGRVVQFNPDGTFHGWVFRRHPDGQFISERKLESVPLPQSPA